MELIESLKYEIELYKELAADFDSSPEEKRFAKEQIKDLLALIEHYENEVK